MSNLKSKSQINTARNKIEAIDGLEGLLHRDLQSAGVEPNVSKIVTGAFAFYRGDLERQIKTWTQYMTEDLVGRKEPDILG